MQSWCVKAKSWDAALQDSDDAFAVFFVRIFDFFFPFSPNFPGYYLFSFFSDELLPLFDIP